jgi:hypothetical protein
VIKYTENRKISAESAVYYVMTSHFGNTCALRMVKLSMEAARPSNRFVIWKREKPWLFTIPR